MEENKVVEESNKVVTDNEETQKVSTETEKKRFIKDIVISIVMLFIFGAFISGLYELGKQPTVELTVAHTKIEKQISMCGEVKHEKGKADTYWVKCEDDSFQVLKADYNTYIKDYNATTVTEYSLKISGTKRIMFWSIPLKEKVYKRTSYVFKPADDYTKEEIKAMKNKYVKYITKGK